MGTLQSNEYQKQAIAHKDGPCLVTSCPGSGKTFTLVERVIALIKSGVEPKSLLCITFTNKAANEMKERVCDRLGIEKPGFFVGTFHSLCAKILRKIGPGRGYNSNFTILADKDQIDMVMQVARHLEHDIKVGDARRIAHALNFFRDQMEDSIWLHEKLRNPALIEIAETYLERCKNSSMIDFSGLISEAIRIIEEDEDIKNKIQNTFKYILVDETQDTNKSQFYLVNLLGGKWKNIMLIGDIDQCIVEGENVLIPNGYKKIEELERGEEVLAASGGGRVSNAKVSNIYKKRVVGRPVVRVTTVSGKKIIMTKEHMIFADYIKSSPKKIIVYLMYDKEFGYRVGVTNTKRKHGLNGMGVGARLQQERAECLWILKSVETVDEAKYWEQYYSIYYGIPTWCFYSDKKQRHLDYSDDSIKKLFSSIDTVKNANKVMVDKWLFEDRPHYVPKCMNKEKRRNFTINMCADPRSGTSHRYSISGSEEEEGKKLKKMGLNVRGLCKGRRGWRVESSCKSMSKIYDILDIVRGSLEEVNIIEKARFCEETLSLMPASHLREGMAVYIEENGGICLDYIESVEFDFYTGNIYDIDVDDYHNFITNGIVSHNSIYRFRGANYKNIEEFLDMYPECNVISLSKNYRSTPEIIKVADKLIKRNKSHIKIKFETDNKNGESVKCYSFGDQNKEAEWIAKMVKKLMEDGGWDPEDMAVLYRVNKMSEPIEQALATMGIPYEVVGSWNFYDRKEARDCIAMLKLISNNKDAISFHRVASMIKGLGDINIGRIEKRAAQDDISLLDAALLIKDESNSSSVKKGCQEIYDRYNCNWDFSNPSKCLSAITERLGYRDILNNKYGGDAAERWENVEQIVDACGEFNGYENGLNQYLQQISLVTAADNADDTGKVSLMTLHAAKGLEFPIVFMIGVEEGILPHQQAVIEDLIEGLEEERRLCYVGFTRAKKVLYVTWCRNRKRFGKFGAASYKASKPSEFLKECGLMRDE